MLRRGRGLVACFLSSLGTDVDDALSSAGCSRSTDGVEEGAAPRLRDRQDLALDVGAASGAASTLRDRWDAEAVVVGVIAVEEKVVEVTSVEVAMVGVIPERVVGGEVHSGEVDHGDIEMMNVTSELTVVEASSA